MKKDGGKKGQKNNGKTCMSTGMDLNLENEDEINHEVDLLYNDVYGTGDLRKKILEAMIP